MNSRGVTIAELSVVIVVIGLLIAAVSTGINVLKASEIRGITVSYTHLTLPTSPKV